MPGMLRLIALTSILSFVSCSSRSPEAPASESEPEPDRVVVEPELAQPELAQPEPELALVETPEPIEAPIDPFPDRTKVSVAELLEALTEQVAYLADSPTLHAEYEEFLTFWKLADDPELYLDYVRIRLAFEATRAGGLWGVTWAITNQQPQSDLVWTQWKQLDSSDEAPLPEVTAIAECDELSALFAFVVHRIGLSKRSEVGLLWPTGNHTVAVWTLDRKSDKPTRIVVPTSQIYLGRAESLGTGEFNPWRQKNIFDYEREDAKLKLELPAPLAREFVRVVHEQGARPLAELQQQRNERERRQWALIREPVSP